MVKNPVHILLIDDDEGDRKQLKRALKKSHYTFEIKEASCIKDAIAACQSHHFDCAIVDYNLPDQNGLEGVVSLQEVEPYLAIIMSTGQGDETIASEAIKKGACDYLQKSSISSEKVIHLIENSLEKTALKKTIDNQNLDLQNFAHVLVHDLKAPIGLIMHFMALIKEHVENASFDKITNYCNKSHQVATHMRDLIDGLYTYINSEKTLEPEIVSMDDALSQALHNLHLKIQKKQAQVSYDPLPEVLGNRSLYIEVFQNLIDNALKYCEANNPTVHIGVQNIEDRLRFSVSDNGIGIDQNELKNIFNTFCRLHGSSKYRGSGLGLSICKRIIEKNHGTIWCESKTGKGATFFFELPSLSSKTRAVSND